MRQNDKERMKKKGEALLNRALDGPGAEEKKVRSRREALSAEAPSTEPTGEKAVNIIIENSRETAQCRELCLGVFCLSNYCLPACLPACLSVCLYGLSLVYTGLLFTCKMAVHMACLTPLICLL